MSKTVIEFNEEYLPENTYKMEIEGRWLKILKCGIDEVKVSISQVYDHFVKNKISIEMSIPDLDVLTTFVRKNKHLETEYPSMLDSALECLSDMNIKHK